MYANMLVKLADGAELAVWSIERAPELGKLRLLLDAQDGSGSYCEPDGHRDVDLVDVDEILANF